MRGERADAAAARRRLELHRGRSATASARPSTPRRRTASPSSTRTRSRTRRRTGATTCCARSSSRSTCSNDKFKHAARQVQQAQHDRDRLQRLERRRRFGARGRAGRRGADRRRRGRRAERQPEVQQQLLDRAGRRAGVLRAQQAADRLHHAGQRVPGLRQPRARERHAPGSISRRARRAAPTSRPRACSPRRRSPIRRPRRRRSSTPTASCPSRTWCSRATGFANVSQSISVTYANTYGRFSVLDNLCSFSFAANGGVPGGPPVALAAAERGADLRHQQRHSADLRRSRSSTTRRRADRRRIAARRRTRISTARSACARSRPARTR